MDLYHVCSNYSPRAKNGPYLGGQLFYIGLLREMRFRATLALLFNWERADIRPQSWPRTIPLSKKIRTDDGTRLRLI